MAQNVFVAKLTDEEWDRANDAMLDRMCDRLKESWEIIKREELERG